MIIQINDQHAGTCNPFLYLTNPPRKIALWEEPGELFVVRSSFGHRWMDTERYVVPLSHDEAIRILLEPGRADPSWKGIRNGKVLITLSYHSEDIKSVKPIINGWFTFFVIKKPWSSFFGWLPCVSKWVHTYTYTNE